MDGAHPGPRNLAYARLDGKWGCYQRTHLRLLYAIKNYVVDLPDIPAQLRRCRLAAKGVTDQSGIGITITRPGLLPVNLIAWARSWFSAVEKSPMGNP